LKKGISTKRSTNPLNPIYSLLGAKELTQDNNNPYGTSYNWKLKKKEFMKIDDSVEKKLDRVNSCKNNLYNPNQNQLEAKMEGENLGDELLSQGQE
jgi:hypothetical protein